MQLTKFERLVLSNQYQILELLEADANMKALYADLRRVYRDGFEDEYEGNSYVLNDGLCKEECEFVQDVLGMFRTFQQAMDDGYIERRPEFTFRGFSGRSEPDYLAYSTYLRSKQQSIWYDAESHINSETPRLDEYRRLFNAFESEQYSYMSPDKLANLQRKLLTSAE